jgi:hypothetical protein
LEKAILLVISMPKVCYRAEPTPVQERAKSQKGGGGGEQEKRERHEFKSRSSESSKWDCKTKRPNGVNDEVKSTLKCLEKIG